MPFPNQVNVAQAPAVWGDFSAHNPRFSYDAGPSALITGPAGVTIGRFIWAAMATLDGDNAPQIANNNGVGTPIGFIHREQQGLNTVFLAEAGMVIPGGFPVTAMIGGDFWAKNEGLTTALPGQSAMASYVNGALSFAAAGSVPNTASTASSVAASTFSVTASIGGPNGNIMTVTGVTSGTVVNGATISGTGITAGTQITSQLTPLLSGEALGGIGRYTISIPEQSAASTTVSGTYGTLTLGGAPSNGNFVVGGVISGTSVVAGTQVTQVLTGSGGAGSTLAVNNNTVVASTTITETLAFQTKWVAMNAAAPGELVKISDHLLG